MDLQALRGLADLAASGERDADAHTLLDSVTHGRLDRQVRDRIVAETQGNPLALQELPRGLTMTQMAGGFGLLRADALMRCRTGSSRASWSGSVLWPSRPGGGC
ncbi:MAG TPA: hypothetical protein VM347_27795 [Nonomuraea sp.]|nr:hypothetical protein [Nonomuraea sp.]